MEIQFIGLHINGKFLSILDYIDIRNIDWIQHMGVSNVKIIGMFSLIAGLIAFFALMFGMLKLLSSQHKVTLEKFKAINDIGELDKNNPDIEKIASDTTILKRYIRRHNHITFLTILNGLIILVGYGLHLLDIEGTVVTIFGISSFKWAILSSLAPFALFGIYYNIKIYRIYKKWPNYFKDPYQWF